MRAERPVRRSLRSWSSASQAADPSRRITISRSENEGELEGILRRRAGWAACAGKAASAIGTFIGVYLGWALRTGPSVMGAQPPMGLGGAILCQPLPRPRSMRLPVPARRRLTLPAPAASAQPPPTADARATFQPRLPDARCLGDAPLPSLR